MIAVVPQPKSAESGDDGPQFREKLEERLPSPDHAAFVETLKQRARQDNR
jgi:hypothetical protein